MRARLAWTMLAALAMVPALARAQSVKSPVRMAFVYVPNGIDMRNWTLDYEGRLGALTRFFLLVGEPDT